MSITICVKARAPFVMTSEYRGNGSGTIPFTALDDQMPFGVGLSASRPDLPITGFDIDFSTFLFGTILDYEATFLPVPTYVEFYLAVRSGICDVGITAVEPCVVLASAAAAAAHACHARYFVVPGGLTNDDGLPHAPLPPTHHPGAATRFVPHVTTGAGRRRITQFRTTTWKHRPLVTSWTWCAAWYVRSRLFRLGRSVRQARYQLVDQLVEKAIAFPAISGGGWQV
jgi:ABC-type amino acid transport substrate-binding protein